MAVVGSDLVEGDWSNCLEQPCNAVRSVCPSCKVHPLLIWLNRYCENQAKSLMY